MPFQSPTTFTDQQLNIDELKQALEEFRLSQKQDFLNDNWKFETLTFKWSRSGVCRIYDKRNNKTEFVAGGGGYDKKGSVLGAFINTYFGKELKKLTADNGGKAFHIRQGFYGLTHYNPNAKSQSRR